MKYNLLLSLFVSLSFFFRFCSVQYLFVRVILAVCAYEMLLLRVFFLSLSMYSTIIIFLFCSFVRHFANEVTFKAQQSNLLLYVNMSYILFDFSNLFQFSIFSPSLFAHPIAYSNIKVMLQRHKMPGANSFKRIRSSECFELFLCVCVFWRVGVCMLWRIVVHVSERKFLVSQCAWCVCRCLSSGGTRQQWPTGSGVKFIEIALYLCLSRKLTKRHNAHDLAGVYSKSDSD